jgi:hypothetical protein
VATVYTSTAFQNDPSVTATHALVIGVGEYPHLKRTRFSSVKPLGSPPRSAKAVADWFLRGATPGTAEPGFHNDEAPLGTLEMLMSPSARYASPAGGEHALEVPTRDRIEEVFGIWLQRLGQNANSRGVFYFCGHGLIDGRDQVLLADDFGINGNQKLWAKAFNISSTPLGAIRQTPATLFFFVDACMEFSEDLAFQQGINPQALVDLDGQRTPLTTEWVILRAATPGLRAFAPTDGVSRFTAALLKGLSGFCGKQKIGTQTYVVTWPQLRDATAEFLERESRKSENKQTLSEAADGRGAVALHVLNQRPNVSLHLDVVPNGYRAAAKVYVRGSPPFERQDCALTDGPAEFVVPQNTYHLGAESVGDAFVRQELSDLLLLCPVQAHEFRISTE